MTTTGTTVNATARVELEEVLAPNAGTPARVRIAPPGSAYRIELFTGWLFNTRHAWFRERMPLCARGGGGQLWLRKLAR